MDDLIQVKLSLSRNLQIVPKKRVSMFSTILSLLKGNKKRVLELKLAGKWTDLGG